MRRCPPALLRTVQRTLESECGVLSGDSILLGVSGGSDSIALLHALSILRTKVGFALVACGIDHGLRREACEELSIAETLCARLRVEFHLRPVCVEPGGNLQARARTARYAELRELQARIGANWLATAHHAQDRAETVLLRLLRGAAPDGLGVLAPRDSDLIRPMIRATKPDVLAHLERHGLAYAEDPSNQDPRFLRTRVRRELLPLMEDLSPGIVGHLNGLADEAQGAGIPELFDESGEPVRFNRSQRAELRRALRDRSSRTRVLLSGHKVVQLDFRTGQPRLALLEEDSVPSSGSSRPRDDSDRAVKPKTG